MLNKSSAEAQQNTSTSSSNPTSIAQSTSAPVINEFTNQSQSENSNGSNDQQIQSVTQGMSMAQASVTTSSRLPSPSPRRTRANKKPKNIVTDTGSASAQASPHAPKQPSKLSYPPQNIEVEIVNKLDEVQMDVDEFVVPISLPTRVYDQYVEVLHRYSEDHAKFMRNLNPEPVTIRAMEKMIVELDNVVTHPDLLDKTVLDEEVDLAGGELNYGRLSSYKFGLLYAILKEVHGGLSYGIPEGLAEILKGSTQLQMAIVVQEGKLYEILTRFLLLMNISFTSVDDGVQHHQEKQGNLNLIVVSSSFSRPAELPAVDIVYAMDSSYDRQSTLVQSLKGYEGHRTRVLFPWVFASPEHVRACLPLMEGPLDPLRTFTQILVQAVPELGQLKGTWNKPSDKRMDVAGFHLGRWITKGFAEGYPLSGLDGVPLTGLEMVVKPSRKRSLVCHFPPFSLSEKKALLHIFISTFPFVAIRSFDNGESSC